MAFVLLFVLKHPWNLVVFVPYMGLMAVAYWILTRALRTCHRLNDTQLLLQMGGFRLAVDRRLITAAESCSSPVPRGVPMPASHGYYHVDDDTLYVLAGRKGRVALRLSEPIEVRVRRQGFVQFTRLVLSLDEPERFLAGFRQGQHQLYTSRLADLVHLSPAPTLSPLVAYLGAELPGRAGSALVIAIGLGMLLPPPSRLTGIVLLWITGLAAGLLGLCAGLLVAWVRLAPRTLDVVWNGMLFGFMALFLYLGYAMVAGAPLTVLVVTLVRLRFWLAVGLAVLFGLPGMGMALWLAISPQGVAAAYRRFGGRRPGQGVASDDA